MNAGMRPQARARDIAGARRAHPSPAWRGAREPSFGHPGRPLLHHHPLHREQAVCATRASKPSGSDKLLLHKTDLFGFLQQRWKSLFGADFDVLLYDLTSTYFECDPPEAGKRRFGYSRDKRSDCVQVVIALIVTPDGFAAGLRGNGGQHLGQDDVARLHQADRDQYGTARRTWVMDRGIPTMKVLAEMRASETPIQYLVGTPRGRLGRLEHDFLAKPWAQVRDAVQVNLVEQDGELYILARSGARRDKEPGLTPRSVLEKMAAIQMVDVYLPTTDGRTVIRRCVISQC